jgi:hypothetical protein
MTSYSPRIYIYKITFEEVPYYYYGVHKEKSFDEEYWGSPYTHKWVWEFYTPKKQILEFFEYSNEGWLEANKVEKKLIRPVYNTDKLCLNENCGGVISLEICSNGGKIMGKITGKKNKELGLGVCGRTKEQMTEDGRMGGKKIKELSVGIFELTSKQLSKNGKKGGKKGSKKTNAQKWKCLETGFITNPGNLTKYQRKRGIDTSKRVKIS